MQSIGQTSFCDRITCRKVLSKLLRVKERALSGQWVFDGWIYQHGDDPVGGPVSTAVLRQMLSAGQLQPADLAWKHLTRGQEVCFSSPIRVEMAAKEEE